VASRNYACHAGATVKRNPVRSYTFDTLGEEADMAIKENVREREYKGCNVRVTVRGSVPVYYWEVKVTCPNGWANTFQASPYGKGDDRKLKNTEEAAFVAGFRRGEEIVDERLSDPLVDPSTA
jgi:hypothetical protein